ncbi:MAG: 23S rRNA (guanosine(2251)-2'-O)-methyltransferase RlmB [Candidatus Bathyarchaeota archaeon]|nr:23S rRNA (guanosine(2251)-2'-O)-methyltransferase RlmB [Candidatus Bathyarchaeota archaeon]
MSQVEGRNPVYETMKRGGVKRLLVLEGLLDERIDDILAQAKRLKVPVERVTRERLDKMSKTKHHQGVIALVDAPGYVSLESVLKKTGKDVCVLILDGVQDPQNLGSVLRTGDAAKVDVVLIPRKDSAGLTPTVFRVSMGGAANVPVSKESIYPAVKLLKAEGIRLIAIDTSGKHDYWDMDLTGAVAFVLGGEGEGISPTLLDKCDMVLRIPMKGQVPNLNVGVSAAVVLYERLRQMAAVSALST